MKLFYSCTLLLFYLFSPISSWATTYWVATTGNDSNACAAVDGDVDPSTYKLTIANAVSNCVSAGDTVRVKAGTYAPTGSIVTTASGSSSATRVRIVSDTLHGAIIRPTNNAAPYFWENHGNWVDIEGFDVDGVNNAGKVRIGWYNFGTDVRWINNKLHDFTSSSAADIDANGGAVISSSGARMTATGNTFYNFGLSAPANPGVHGIYDASSGGATITNNHVYNIERSCLQVYPNATVAATISRNRIHDCTIGLYMLNGNGSILHSNVIYNTSSYAVFWSVSNGRIYNNTISGTSTDDLFITEFAFNTNVSNNIVYPGQIDNSGTNTTQTTNRITNPTFTNSGAGNFTLLSTSTAIDAGTAGVNCTGSNGASGCTQGAYDPPRFLSCRVADGDASTVRVTFTNNRHSPITTGAVTGITIRVDGGDRTESAPTVVGTNVIHYTIDGSAVTVGQAVTWAASSANLVADSANIGNVTSAGQILKLITDQSCTNEVSNPATGTWDLKVFRFHGLFGTEAAPVVKPFQTASNSTAIYIISGGSVRLRLAIIRNTADTLTVTPTLYCKWNAGSYFAVPTAFDSNNVKIRTTADADIPVNATPTTNLLGAVGAGSFVPSVFSTSGAASAVMLAPTNWTEVEWPLELDTDVSAGDVLTCEARDEDGTVLNASPTTRPTATVIGVVASG